MKLTPLGAARNVTGSCSLLETDSSRVLIDCGYFQERKFQHRNWDEFPVSPGSIDAVLLTHAHLDHCGRLPRLVAQGFRGRILATSASRDIAAIVLRDSARLQEEDLRQKKKRHSHEGRVSPHPYEPLYTKEDAEDAISLFETVPYGESVEVAAGLRASWHEAGHILGACSIRVEADEAGGRTSSILFSGDVGRKGMPLIRDPAVPPAADVVVLESTYGDRVHDTHASIPDQLADILNSTHRAGGNLVIPSFAVERTQDLFYHFSGLLAAKRIPATLVFLDSPMAVRVTEVFQRHRDLFDEETRELLAGGHSPCDFPGLKMSRTREQSKAINQIRGTVCVIAGSGMCTGGRIKHHLRTNLPREESTILFVGYQAVGTLGRQILERPRSVRVLGQEVEVRARVEQIQGFSGHADRNELKAWLAALPTRPRRVLLNHGEESVSLEFAAGIAAETGLEVEVPEYGKQVVI